MSLKDITGSIQNLFNQAPQALGNAVNFVANPIGSVSNALFNQAQRIPQVQQVESAFNNNVSKPVINIAHQTIPSLALSNILNSVSNYQIPSSTIPFVGGTVQNLQNAFHQSPTYTPRDIYNFTAPIAQAPFRAISSLKATPVLQNFIPGTNLPQTYQPQGIEKLFLGDQPINSINQRISTGYNVPMVGKVNGLGAAPFVVAGTLLDLLPFSGAEKNAASEGIQLAKKSNTLEDFTKALKGSSQEVRTAISKVIEDSKTPINSLNDFFTVAKKEAQRAPTQALSVTNSAPANTIFQNTYKRLAGLLGGAYVDGTEYAKGSLIDNYKQITKDIFGASIYPEDQTQLMQQMLAELRSAGYSDATLKDMVSSRTYKTINPQDAVSEFLKNRPVNKLDNLPQLRETRPGSFTNVRSIDNRLVNGEKIAEDLHTNISKFVNTALDSKSPQAIEHVQQIIDPEFTNVLKKVNGFDYLKTPEAVLKKIGLGDQAVFLRKQYEGYLTQLPKEIESLRNLASRVPGVDSSRNIFNYLDGASVKLTPTEQKVAGEIKTYLKDWADKLGLPEDKRVSSYITHIFEKGVSQAEFNDEVAKLIDQKVAGSVYNPFLESRKENTLPYIQDVWRALDAYTKRAVRKYYMDPALQKIAGASGSLELSQYKYVQRLTDRINLRPTELDTLIDNWVKSIPGVGYRMGQRPVATITHGIRQTIYRSTLGLNASSAIRNLTQGANTYAELGEKYTIIGYTNLARNWNSGELERVGVLQDSFIQDKQLSIAKQLVETVDKGLFFLFEKAEKINRGAAYFGAKSKALAKGMSEEQAIEYAKELVRKTQFTFGSVDTPLALSSDVWKTLLQLQSYNIKQLEFLKDKVVQKEYAGIVRWVGATLAMGYVLKKSFGMDISLIPVSFSASPSVQIVQNAIGAGFGSEDQKAQARQNLIKSAWLAIPGGSQIKKSLEGYGAYQQGYSQTPAGNVRFPVAQTPANLVRGAGFGQYSFPEAQQYFDSKASPLGASQTEVLKQSTDKQGVYNTYMANRQQTAQENQLRSQIKQGSTPSGQLDDSLVKLQVETDGKGRYLSNGDYVYKNSKGNASTISITPPTPGTGIDAFVNQNEKFSQAKNVYKAYTTKEISQHEYTTLLNKLGVSQADTEYDYKASHSTDIKTQYIESKVSDLSHEELLNQLVKGRVVGASGTQFAANGVIDNLYADGVLSKEEATALKKIKTDKNGKSLLKASGARKGKKISIVTSKSPSQKTFSLKLSRAPKIKIGKNTVKITKAKSPAQPKQFHVSPIKTQFTKGRSLQGVGTRALG